MHHLKKLSSGTSYHFEVGSFQTHESSALRDIKTPEV